jgi:MoxR-like ATPase
MFKLVVSYPERAEERLVLDRMTGLDEPVVRPVVDAPALLRARRAVQDIYADDRVKEYVLDLVSATRDPGRAGLADLTPMIEYGVSPRAGIFLLRAAKAHAVLQGRGYVTPDDIKALALDVLRHRVILTYRADAEGIVPDQVLTRILGALRVP